MIRLVGVVVIVRRCVVDVCHFLFLSLPLLKDDGSLSTPLLGFWVVRFVSETIQLVARVVRGRTTHKAFLTHSHSNNVTASSTLRFFAKRNSLLVCEQKNPKP
jgi:hypothetical protein